MTIPLWILAFFAAVAGVLALSNTHVSLSHFVDPVFGSNLYDDHLSTAALWALGTTDAVIAVVGVLIGLRLWMSRAERPALEVSFLKHSWYINELYDTVFGRPSERLAAFSATVIDTKVIDGGVNGVAALVRQIGLAVPPDPDRIPAQLRAGHRPRYRAGAGLHAGAAVVGRMSTGHFPFLTVLVLVPAVGARGDRPDPDQVGGPSLPRGPRCPGGGVHPGAGGGHRRPVQGR